MNTTESLETLVYEDELTALYNRRYLREQFGPLCAAAHAEGHNLSVLFIDVDHFKSVNDRFGHDQGDRVLTMVATAIRHYTPPDGIAIRWAGDEFIVLLPGVSKTLAVASAIKLLERVRVEGWMAPNGEVLRQTLSIGVASYPADTDKPDSLRELADEAAVYSKKKGRNAVSTVEARRPETLDPNRLFRYFPCRRFLGRTALFNQCKAAITSAPHLVRPCLILKGPRGIGRSRFLLEVEKCVDLQRTHLLRMRCQPHLTGQPFGELAEALLALLETDPERIEALAKLDLLSLAALSPFVPALVRFGLVQPGPVPNLPAPKLVEAMGKLLRALAADRPVILILDDFQWSNQGTRLALQAARGGGQQDLAIFAGLVDDAAQTGDEELKRWLGESERAGWLDRRTLTDFTPENVREMMDSIIPGLGMHAELLAMIQGRSKGRPMMVEGLIKLLIHRDKVQLQNGHLTVTVPPENEIPANLEDYFIPRVMDLDPTLGRVLSRAAVLGDSFKVEVLSILANMSEAELLAVLDLARKQSLVTLDESRGTYAFQERAVRQVLYEGLAEDERKELHGTAGRVLEARAGPQTDANLSELAWHFTQAGDVEKSQQHLSKLSDEYRSLISPQAVEMYVGKLPPRKAWGVETVLAGPAMEAALRVAKRFRVCLQNLAHYPSSSEMVHGALDSLHRELVGVLQLTEVLSLTEADGRLMINGEVPNQRDSELAGGPELVSLFSSAELRGISMQRDILKDELLDFLDLILMRPAERETRGGWDALLAERGIVHLITNERVYVAIGEKDLDVARKGPTVIIEEPPSEPEQKDKIPDDVVTALKEAVATLQTGSEADRQLAMQRIMELVGRLGSSVPAPPVPLAGPARPRPELGLAGKYLQLSSQMDMYGFNQIGLAMDVLIHDIGSTDDTLSEAAGLAIAAKGQPAIEPLLRLVRAGESLRVRRKAFHLLRKLDPNITRRMLDDMVVGERPEEAHRTLEVLVDFANLDLDDWLPFLVRHPDPGTRHGVLDLLAERPTERSMKVLVAAVETARGDALVDVIAALGQAKWEPAVPALCRLLRKRLAFFPEGPWEPQRAACRALGLIGNPRALPALFEVLKLSPPYMFLRNKSSEVREAAALALSFFPNRRTQAALQRLTRDKHVGAAAMTALSRMDGRTAAERPGESGPPLLSPALPGRATERP